MVLKSLNVHTHYREKCKGCSEIHLFLRVLPVLTWVILRLMNNLGQNTSAEVMVGCHVEVSIGTVRLSIYQGPLI